MRNPGTAGRRSKRAIPWAGGTKAPSALPHSEGEEAPEALGAAGLEKVVDDFVQAARRSVALGLQGIELHAAHGYLLHQFLSPIANRRDDEYGGSLENRMRFPLAVFDAVKAAVPDSFPVWVRVSASDWVEGGWDIEGTIAFSKALEERGCAAMHVSSGGVSPDQRIEVGPGYQLHFAEAVKKAVSIPVIGVGLITDARQAEQVIQDGQADAVALARAMLYDPRWPWHAAAELGASVAAPPQYFRCQPHGLKDLFEAASHGQR